MIILHDYMMLLGHGCGMYGSTVGHLRENEGRGEEGDSHKDNSAFVLYVNYRNTALTQACPGERLIALVYKQNKPFARGVIHLHKKRAPVLLWIK